MMFYVKLWEREALLIIYKDGLFTHIFKLSGYNIFLKLEWDMRTVNGSYPITILVEE